MLMLALNWQSGVDPVGLAFGVIANLCVAQRRQFTGGVLGSMSGW